MYVEILRSGQNMAENYQYARSSIETNYWVWNVLSFGLSQSSKLKVRVLFLHFTCFVYVLSATTERHRLPQKFHAIVRSALSDKPLPVFSQKNVFFLRYRIWSNFNHDDWLYSTRNVWFSSSLSQALWTLACVNHGQTMVNNNYTSSL